MVPCTAGTTNCASGGEIGFSATPGYDEASGLGSVDAYNLVMEWPGGSGNLPAPSLSAPLNGATGQLLSPAFAWSQVSEQQWLRHHDRAESRRADYHSFHKHLRRSMHGCHDLGESEHLHPVVRSGGGDLLLGRAGSSCFRERTRRLVEHFQLHHDRRKLVGTNPLRTRQRRNGRQPSHKFFVDFGLRQRRLSHHGGFIGKRTANKSRYWNLWRRVFARHHDFSDDACLEYCLSHRVERRDYILLASSGLGFLRRWTERAVVGCVQLCHGCGGFFAECVTLHAVDRAGIERELDGDADPHQQFLRDSNLFLRHRHPERSDLHIWKLHQQRHHLHHHGFFNGQNAPTPARNAAIRRMVAGRNRSSSRNRSWQDRWQVGGSFCSSLVTCHSSLAAEGGILDSSASGVRRHPGDDSNRKLQLRREQRRGRRHQWSSTRIRHRHRDRHLRHHHP